ncbi:phosphoribosylaminoimidazolecarboxamide formyltransferase [Arcanobacterium buesumense]|uniref:Phosphoribosylaminoimidazolecarboxamide formyltransferase n=1 Tax=Arcanobacterium buesumense TaxID=2722751 RepID=A0A6H2EK36_9ACTO|nr:phosphoribosylaminoimidazolecarboxamide formyltransferase [Arcanobacterium buesumense]QJC21706.1 phosphoribosylaminoimidazolecarboxamide formyltransferase [Arcanobacterium buesumense]
MNRLELKYGNNPHQKPAHISIKDRQDLPLTVLNGQAGYINLLDALNGWQLVRELKKATGMPAATSFKHVSPTSAAIGRPLSDTLKKMSFADDIEGLEESGLACAYVRARGTDRMCSFGDFVALSDICDAVTAQCLKREVSDGVIAPGYSPEALEILCAKRTGNYTVIQIDPAYEPEPIESKDVFGITFTQRRNDLIINESLLNNIVTRNKELSAENKQDLLIALITLKYTQSNSVCYAYQGQTIGVGAGQQSRIHCTRLAGDKADTWFLRQHPKVLALPFLENLGRATRDNVIDSYINQHEEDVCLDGVWQNYFVQQPAPLTDEEKKNFLVQWQGVSLASDAFFPFSDNIKRAVKSGVSYVVQPGGSIRDDAVIDECNEHNIVMICNGTRFFHH